MSQLIKAYSDHFCNGGGFATISAARSFAAPYLPQKITPGSPQAKQVDEALEAALVRVAQTIVAAPATPQQTFHQLVDLHSRQPALNVRSSTSISQQAYSTPLPLAYLASVLAKITPSTSVYEPSAGHGALLLGTNPAHVTVNELNQSRADDLREQGYTVTQQDAALYLPPKQHDIVILNPPFGTVQAGGRPKQFSFGDFRTNQIDHAIALNSLQAMKPNGRALLILGGKLGIDENKRSHGYNSQESRGFYFSLYRDFNVTEHFSVLGDLYRKQGAGFPIDMIVVEGKGKSARLLPGADVPRIYRTFDQLERYLHDFLRTQSPHLGTTKGPTNINSTSAPDRDHHKQPSSLSGTTLPSPGMVDRNVDGISRSILPPTDPSHVDTANQGSLHLHTPSPTADHTTHNPKPAIMAESLGTIPSHGQRPVDNAATTTTSILSSTSRNRPPGANSPADHVPNTGRTADPGGMAAGDHRTNAAVEQQPKQLSYQPKSNAPAIGTLVPANMQTANAQALLRLERQVGDLDAYVTQCLAYNSPQELHRHFSAEQVDAIALAIANLEQGSGFILGDQTGIGKGRVVAAMIRYAKVMERTPIFVTKDPPLYADMIRDLQDIGMAGFRPLVTNPDLKQLPLPDGRVLHTQSKNHNALLEAVQAQGELQGYDAIFTTYSQMQTVKGKEPQRRQFLRAFAPHSILILDESHEAGGSTGHVKPQSGKAGGRRQRAEGENKPSVSQSTGNRADFVRELARMTKGVVYSSATYAKDPAVMDLYFRTDMRLALSNMENLTELVASGGVPLQQTLAAMLTEAGQYVRRERSFAGVCFDPVVVPVNRDSAENIGRIMAEIMEFDRLKQRVVKGMDKELKAEAKAALGDNATGKAGASSTNFTSIMHNVIDQMLFALKAEETVQRSLELLRQPQPEKPVLALSNTMGSLIGSQAELQGLQPGDSLEMDFGALLHRYLERSRDVMIGNPWGEKSRQRLSDAELGGLATAKYHAVQDLINQMDFTQIPVSPIDYITSRLNQEGYRVGEVTGREHIAIYTPSGTIYQRRSQKERSKEAAVRTVKAFNGGELDVIILNRSGSTGISLHASEHFPDQRQRHMIVVQAEADINQFMQMLGRVHRTGQVTPPNFTLLMADIPAEKRPGAVLARKMASLNANTTAARSGGFSLGDIPDFMNEYGDRVVADIMKADPELHAQLDYPLDSGYGIVSDGAIRRVTGRIPLLPIRQQEQLYNRIEHQYQEYVAAQAAMGESVLEASTLDLDAVTLARMEVLPADACSHSPFTGAVYGEIVDAKAPRKPYTTRQVAEKLKEGRRQGAEEPARSWLVGKRSDWRGRREESDSNDKILQSGEQTAPTPASIKKGSFPNTQNPTPNTVFQSGSNEQIFTTRDEVDFSHTSYSPLTTHLQAKNQETEDIREESDSNDKIFKSGEQTAPTPHHPLTSSPHHPLTPTPSYADTFATILETGHNQAAAKIAKLQENARQYKLQVSGERAASVDNGLSHVTRILEEFPVGQPICLTNGHDDEFYGMVAQVKHTGVSNNPVAPSAWEIRLLLADSIRELTLPLSQVNSGKENGTHLTIAETTPQGMPVYQLFDDCQTRTREKRQIFTGNLLRAWEKFPGRMVNFTDVQGNIRQGLLTRRGFDVEAALEKMAVPMPTIEDAQRFLTECGGQLKTADRHLTIKPEGHDTFCLQAPKSKNVGGKYYLDEALLHAAGGEFFSVGERMECEVAGERLEAVLAVLMRERDYTLAAYEQPERARAMLGMALPQFTEVEPPTPPVMSKEGSEDDKASPPASQFSEGDELTVETTASSELVVTTDTDATLQESTTEAHPEAIAPVADQQGSPEKNVAKLLQQGGLLAEVMAGEDFHQKIDNQPYIPLVIERHGNQLYLTHYLTQNGDMYIDSEMVFAIDGKGTLSLQETAVSALGGELRYCDRYEANLFSRNLLQQGFGEAIKHSHTHAVRKEEVTEISNTTVEKIIEPSRVQGNGETGEKEKGINIPGGSERNSSLMTTEPVVPVPTLEPQKAKEQVYKASPLLPTPSASSSPYPHAQDVALWAMAVRDLGLPERIQRSVQTLYRQVRDGEQPPMPEKVWKTMARDVEQYRPYQERGQQLLDAAGWILTQAGVVNAKQEREFKGKTYEILERANTLTVKKQDNDRQEVILQAQHNHITRTTVTSQDVEMFAVFVQHLQAERSGRLG